MRKIRILHSKNPNILKLTAPLNYMATKALSFLEGMQGDRDTFTEFRRANYYIHTPNAEFTAMHEDTELLKAALSNPAFLKVLALNCDLFSLGKIYVYDKNGAIVEDDPVLKLLSRPNPLQYGSQFLWDFMFWVQMGNAYCYVDSSLIDRTTNKLYMLNPGMVEFPQTLIDLKDKLILSEQRKKSLEDANIIYHYGDGTKAEFPYKKMIHVPDLSGGIGNWFHAPSKVAALRKVLANVEAGLDSTNINIRFAGKFLVAGMQDPKDVYKTPLTNDEKLDIERKTNGNKPVSAVKSMVDIKRFVEDFSKLQLSTEYKDAYFIIGSMFGIPRDVLEAYNSGTYENQEKATGKHISYSLQPKGDIFMTALAEMFGYTEQGKKIVIDWEHLPFMQVFAKDRADTEFKKVQSLEKLLSLGVPIESINKFLDTEFELS